MPTNHSHSIFLSRTLWSVAIPDGDDSVFKCSLPVPIPLADYAIRAKTYMHCSDDVFIVAAIYCWRLHMCNPNLFDALSLHKIMAASLVLAVKYTEDEHYPMKHYAQVFGMSAKELNTLENEMITWLDWCFFFNDLEFQTMAELVK